MGPARGSHIDDLDRYLVSTGVARTSNSRSNAFLWAREPLPAVSAMPLKVWKVFRDGKRWQVRWLAAGSLQQHARGLATVHCLGCYLVEDG